MTARPPSSATPERTDTGSGTVSLERLVGDLVTEDPGRTRVLDRYRIDYCCGGGRTLAEACSQAGVDGAVVLADLERLVGGPAADWAAMSLTDLCRHIVDTHHAYLWEEMPRLAALAEKVHRVHGERHPELERLQEVYQELQRDLEPHLLREERVLFPAIEALEAVEPEQPVMTLVMPIRVMMAEHDSAGELLVQLRDATGGYLTPADGCGSYTALMSGLEQLEQDTHLHIHKENNVLFPAVLRLQQQRQEGRRHGRD